MDPLTLMPAMMPQAPQLNGFVPNSIPRSIQNGLIGGISNIRNSEQAPLRPSRDTILNMYADVETYPMGGRI